MRILVCKHPPGTTNRPDTHRRRRRRRQGQNQRLRAGARGPPALLARSRVEMGLGRSLSQHFDLVLRA